MAFKRPTLKELIDQTKNDFQNQLTGFSDSLRFSLSKVFSYVIAGCTHLLFGFLDYIAKQALPDTCDIETIRRWGIIFAVYEKEATFAECDIQLAGVNGAPIPSGTYLINPITKVEYRTTSEVTIAIGVATAHVEALTEGKIGTVIDGDVLTLISPIAGVQNQATVLSDNLLSGQDKEDIELYRARVLERMQNPPLGGANVDYISWAKEIAGVTRAWVYPNYLGLGTVGVAFVLDDEDDIIPSPAQVTEVQDYIDLRRPVTAQVTVFAPIAEEVDLTIEINPNTSEMQQSVIAELQDLFKRRAVPSGKIYLSEISESISVASGEIAHHLISPIIDFQATAGKIPKLGTITWQTLA